MKKIVLFLSIIFLALPCFANNKEPNLQNIFITDVSEAEEYLEPANITLKGYAQFMEDNEAIHLLDENNQFVLNIKVPQKINSKRITNLNQTIYARKPTTFSKYGAEEYTVTPKSGNAYAQAGNFSFGTIHEQLVDTGELEQASGLFTRYEVGKFAIDSAYKRTIGSTYNNYMDKFYIAPEVKLNKVFAIKEIISSDITRNRKSAEFVLSIKPLPNANRDRLNFEIGAGQTFDSTNVLIKNQLRFSTQFKL